MGRSTDLRFLRVYVNCHTDTLVISWTRHRTQWRMSSSKPMVNGIRMTTSMVLSSGSLLTPPNPSRLKLHRFDHSPGLMTEDKTREPLWSPPMTKMMKVASNVNCLPPTIQGRRTAILSRTHRVLGHRLLMRS